MVTVDSYITYKTVIQSLILGYVLSSKKLFF